MNNNAKLSTQPYKGTRDFYPEDMRIEDYIFRTWEKVAKSFGYEKYSFPFLEPFELYEAKTGEEIVNQQLYSFEDKGGRKVAIRPEVTPSVARLVAARLETLPKPIRWYSYPNLWRYEKPQRGRLREHYQLNVDIFGVKSMIADAEIIATAVEMLKAFGAKKDYFVIKINNRKLINYFFKNIVKLDPNQNVKAIKAIDKIDKIEPRKFVGILTGAGISKEQIDKIYDFLNTRTLANTIYEKAEGAREIERLFSYLKDLGVDEYCEFVPSIVRGFDYYTGTVFEVNDRSGENTRSMFGGGRYDDLLTIFDKPKLPAVGYGMGDVTLRDFLGTHELLPNMTSETKVMIACFSEENKKDYQKIAKRLRDKGINTILYLEADKLDKQIKYANKKGIPFVIIQGPDELKKSNFVLKDMTKRTQETLDMKAVIAKLVLVPKD